MKRVLVLLLLLFLLAPQVSGQGYLGSNAGGRITHGGLDVNIQDQHTRALDLRFIMATSAPTTLAAKTVVDANTITLTSAVGFVDGTYVVIAEAADKFYTGTQIGAPAGNVITLDSPLDQAYEAGDIVLPTTYDMTVDGSGGSPKVFQVGSSGSTAEIDITRVLGYILDTDAMDDSKFGSIPALTNGCVLRVSNGAKVNVWNVKSNGDFALLGYDLTYPDKPPAGKNSMRFRITYAGQDKHGVTLRLDPGDFLEFIIQDDLTGLEIFNLMAQGHIVE